MKRNNKIFNAILSVLLITAVVSGLFTTSVAAAEPTKVNISVNKRQYNTAAESTTPNTGELMENFGGTPLAGAEFTIYDVTDSYHTKMKTEGASQTTVIKEIQQDFTSMAPEGSIVINKPKLTDREGIATFEGLNIMGEDGRFMVYVIVETKTPTSVSVTEKSVPMVLAMPVYKLTDGKPNSVLNTDIQLYPKNITALDFKEFTNSEIFESVQVGDEKHYNIPTGANLDFKISLNVPTDITQHLEYSVSDTPTKGLEYISKSINIEGLELNQDYSIEEEATTGGFKIIFNLKSEAVKGFEGKVLAITYKMTLTKDVVPDTLYENKAQVSVSGNLREEMTTGPDNPKFYTNGHKFVKKDAQTGNELAGAEFILGVSKEKYATFIINSKGEYVFEAWTSKDLATKLISGENGEIHVIGLTKGDYFLNETKAPSDRYVAINGNIDFTINSGYATMELQSIINHAKGLLPSTGGNGIYGFLIVGSLIMLGSVLWFKKSNINDVNA